jgi:hypothetical protein
MRPYIAILTLLLSYSASAQDVPEAVPWPQLRELAVQFNQKVSDKAFLEKYGKKIDGMVQQRLIENNSLTEDGILRSIMLDWAASNSDKIVERDEQAVSQACYFLVKFVDKGYSLPPPVHAELTPGVVGEIKGYLEKRLAEVESEQPGQIKVVAAPGTLCE